MIISEEKYREIFDSDEDRSRDIVEHVRAHLLEQGKLALDGTGTCLYRLHSPGRNGPTTLACAAGCLIPNEHFDPTMERRPISRIIHENHQKLSGMERYVELISILQEAHDGWPLRVYGANLTWAEVVNSRMDAVLHEIQGNAQ